MNFVNNDAHITKNTNKAESKELNLCGFFEIKVIERRKLIFNDQRK